MTDSGLQLGTGKEELKLIMDGNKNRKQTTQSTNQAIITCSIKKGKLQNILSTFQEDSYRQALRLSSSLYRPSLGLSSRI